MDDRERDERGQGERNGERKEAGSMFELIDLLDKFGTVMLVTVNPDGLLRSRPMSVQDPRQMPDCDLWFVTSDDSPKASELERDDRVCVCGYRAIDRAWVSISARARLERDEAQLKRLWKKTWDAWMPSGPEDPHAAFLKLVVERAEYWQPAGGVVKVLFEVARALVTNKPATLFLPPSKIVERKRAA